MEKPYVPEGKLLFFWGSGYMLLDEKQFNNLPQTRRTKMVAAACKAAERSTKC